MANKTASRNSPRIVVLHNNAGSAWRWVAHLMPEYNWHFVQAPSATGGVGNKLSRLWAAFRAVRLSRGADLVLSFDEGLAGAFEAARLLIRNKIPHICYYFNFDPLPAGRKRKRQAALFRNITRFVVSSNVERTIYSNHFGIDPSRFDFILWGVNAPVATDTGAPEGDYVCAVGGNARDYPLLMQVAASRPDIRFIIVVRPANLVGLTIPANVETLCNIPYGDAMAVVKGARLMALPLISTDAPCGHVTIVSTFYLGTPIVVTASTGIEDYVKDRETGLICARDPIALGAAIDRLWNDPDYAALLGANALLFAQSQCTENNYPPHVRGLLAET